MRTNEEMIDYINQLRQEQNMSISELSRRVGMAKSGVSKYFNHSREFSVNRVSDFAKALHVKSEDILGVSTPKNEIEIDPNKIKHVPLIGTIAMGTPITAEQNIERYIPEFFLEDIPSDELIALRCKGHSMEPTIPDGAIAIIHLQPDVEDDEIAAVQVDDDCEATLKRVQHIGDQVFLVPDNKNYKPIVLNKENPGRIIGKMIKYEVTTN